MNGPVKAWLAGLLVVACGVARTTPSERPSGVARIDALVAADDHLRALFRPNAAGFTRDGSPGSSAVSPGYRNAAAHHYAELGASLPATSDGALEVGISRFARLTLSLRHVDVRSVPLVLNEGRAIYADAYRDTDLVLATTPDAIEELVVLRSAAAPARFAYRVELPPGLPRARIEADGVLAFVNAAGETQLSVPRPYAIDARGRRRDAVLSWDGATLEIVLDPSELTYPVALDPALVTWTWRKLETPGKRTAHVLAYDEARDETVLFGGFGADQTALDETWVFSRRSWSKRSPALAPRARALAAMAYDRKRGETVLFGGAAATLAVDDTWTWTGAEWRERTAVNPPPPRQNAAMAYDAKHERAVLFGGFDFSSDGTLVVRGDTWLWDGSTWTQASPATSPPKRFSAAMAYDEERGETVLFGGADVDVFDDTWIWNGTNWAKAAPTTPPLAAENASMAFDPSTKVRVHGECPISWPRQ